MILEPELAPMPRLVSDIDPAQTRPVQELKHDSPLVAGRFDPAGQYLFVTAQDNTIQRWELAGAKKTPLLAHKSWVRALAFVRDPRLLISGDYTGNVLFWLADAEKPEPIRTIAAHKGWCRALAVSPDGKLLASCGNDNLIRLWSLPDGTPVRELAGHDSHVYHVAFHPDGQALASCDLKGVVKHWDLAKGQAVRDLDAKALYKYDPVFRADHGGARDMCFNAEGTLLACAGITNVSNAFAGVGNPAVVLFDWQAGKSKQLLVAKEAFQGTCWGVGFHPAGFLVGAAGGSGGVLLFWKPEEAKSFFTLKLPNNARDLSLHPDGARLAVPYADGIARVYEMTKK